ncbi:Coenzyme F420 hydrogenase/dehydrogenase, beta subunit C-terminal domain [Candidatus Poriferisocius sp.]|uniref:Coenzyme F420 hydrogenase/dehydrogenase, beta subunit C-terminal domain n=1 Tax=Candidatus Poriferisocius sp. TaxID=3101276 RepID=UPI003B018113
MTTVAQIVANDLCVGCGLCETITSGRVKMAMTPAGSLRPSPIDGFNPEEEQTIIGACPGVVAEARSDPGLPLDPIWGHHGTMRHAWAADPEVRFKAATGGVLTALGQYLLDSGTAAFVLHVGADPAQPMRSRWVSSETSEAVLANTGSRYGPTAPLAGLGAALDRNEPLAIIAKPCDLGAVHRLAAVDPRIDELVVARLTMVCGGQSHLSKSQRLLRQLDISETAVSLFRYRGHGNPGPTRVETRDGRAFEIPYLEMWEDEGTWDLETRCKLCPDALGEASDVAVADVWPGGAPVGEDDGFSGIVVRSEVGESLVGQAAADGHIVLGEPISPRELDDMQPHQVRKKQALAARYRGMADAGVSPIATHGLRIEELGHRLSPAEADAQRAGTATRMKAARS